VSIYRHYKGGLYFVEGYATQFSKTFYDKAEATKIVVAKAKYVDTLEEVDVYLIYDPDVKSTYYTYNNEKIDSVLVFYRDLDGDYWLRPREDFHAEIFADEGESSLRFEKISGGHLFDIISDLLSK